MDCYIVWYRLDEEAVDRVRGVARNFKRAEYMARNLKIMLKAFNKEKHIRVGVKRGTHGKLYEDEDLSLKWDVE